MWLPMKTGQHRAWLFTINNPTDKYEPQTWCAKWCVWQLEKVNTLHLQGYVCFPARGKNLAGVRLLCPRAHWEPRYGTHEQAKAYATKIESRKDGPWEYGIEPAQGKRGDLEEIYAEIEGGKSDEYVRANYYGSWVRYYNAFARHRLCVQSKRVRGVPQILMVIGPTGIGKTLTVRECFPNAYWKDKGKFWDGYDGQNTVVFDEFFGWYPYHGLKRLLDSGKCAVEVKGSMVPMLAEVFVFTSNMTPDRWYEKKDASTMALYRRFKEFGVVLYMEPNGWIWSTL